MLNTIYLSTIFRIQVWITNCSKIYNLYLSFFWCYSLEESFSIIHGVRLWAQACRSRLFHADLGYLMKGEVGYVGAKIHILVLNQMLLWNLKKIYFKLNNIFLLQLFPLLNPMFRFWASIIDFIFSYGQHILLCCGG